MHETLTLSYKVQIYYSSRQSRADAVRAARKLFGLSRVDGAGPYGTYSACRVGKATVPKKVKKKP